MSDSGYKVEELPPEATQHLLTQIRRSEEARAGLRRDVGNLNNRRSMVIAGGVDIAGEFEVTARDARSGEIEWQAKQPNLVTYLGLQVWMDYRLNSLRLGFAPSIEAPMFTRSCLSSDVNQMVVSANLGAGSVTPATHTRQLSTTFTTPGSNRTLGTLFLGVINQGIVGSGFYSNVVAYSLLSPAKVQTTTQTIELVYKISVTLIV